MLRIMMVMGFNFYIVFICSAIAVFGIHSEHSYLPAAKEGDTSVIDKESSSDRNVDIKQTFVDQNMGNGQLQHKNAILSNSPGNLEGDLGINNEKIPRSEVFSRANSEKDDALPSKFTKRRGLKKFHKPKGMNYVLEKSTDENSYKEHDQPMLRLNSQTIFARKHEAPSKEDSTSGRSAWRVLTSNNICLNPPDPYRTCYQRAVDVSNDLSSDEIVRNQYNNDAQLYQMHEEGIEQPLPDLLDNLEVDGPYTPPFVGADEELIVGTIYLTLIQDATQITCDNMIAIEETLLKYLKEHIGSESTFSPVCVFNSDHAIDEQLVPNHSEYIVETTALKFDLMFVFKTDFMDEINLHSNGRILRDDIGANEESRSLHRDDVASSFGVCCSQDVTKDKDDDVAYCTNQGYDVGQCAIGLFGQCTGEEKEKCCKKISKNDDNGVKFCESKGCDPNTCPKVSEDTEPTCKDSASKISCCAHYCCDGKDEKDDFDKDVKRYCKNPLDCDWRDCLKSSSAQDRRRNEKIDTNGFVMPSINMFNYPLMNTKAPIKSKTSGLTGTPFNDVIRRYTSFKPEKTHSLWNVTSTRAVASCIGNRYIIDNFGNASLTCKEYQENDCSINEDINEDINEKLNETPCIEETPLINLSSNPGQSEIKSPIVTLTVSPTQYPTQSPSNYPTKEPIHKTNEEITTDADEGEFHLQSNHKGLDSISPQETEYSEKENTNSTKNAPTSNETKNKNNNRKRNRVYKNICLNPPDPYRTCYQRAIDPSNELNFDKITRNRYNHGAQLYKRGREYKPPDPPAKGKGYIPPPSPLEPYTSPFVDTDEQLIIGTIFLTLIEDTTQINCDNIIAIEEVLLQFLKENIGSENTFSPICVFNSEHTSNGQMIPNQLEDVVEATTLKFNIMFAFKSDFVTEIDPQSAQRALSRQAHIRKGTIQEESRYLKNDSMSIASIFGSCCSQNVTKNPEDTVDHCSKNDLDLNLCFAKALTSSCSNSEQSDCCSRIAAKQNRENKKYCASLGCDWREDCQDWGDGLDTGYYCNAESKEECCTRISISQNRENRKFCAGLGCDWRKECKEQNLAPKASHDDMRRANAQSSSSYSPTPSSTSYFPTPSVVSYFPTLSSPNEFPASSEIIDAKPSDGKFGVKQPDKNRPVQLIGNEFNDVIRRYTSFKPGTTCSLLNVINTSSIASCCANRYIMEKFGNPSLTCDEYEENNCGNNEDISIELNEKFCISEPPSKSPTLNPTPIIVAQCQGASPESNPTLVPPPSTILSTTAPYPTHLMYGAPPAPVDGCIWVDVELGFDFFPDETTWVINRADTDIIDQNIAFSPNFDDSCILERYTQHLCLQEGLYQFRIEDNFGDGMCCDYGDGNYTLASNGVVIAQGGEFETEDTVIFSVLQSPSSQPSLSEAPSANPSQIPSVRPSSSQAPSANPSQIPSVRPTSSQAPSAKPSQSSVPSISMEPSTGCIPIEIEIFLDSYPRETFWTIVFLTDSEGGNETIDESPPYDESFTFKSHTLCLKEGQYIFDIGDTFGDGLCCLYGNGFYNLTSYGEIIAQGGEFDYEETVSFFIPYVPFPTTEPTNFGTFTPTASSHPSATQAPSDKPTMSLVPTETCFEVLVLLEFDFFPTETQWTISMTDINGSSEVIAHSLEFDDSFTDGSYGVSFCLPEGLYLFQIEDEFGDGMCCAFGDGRYTLTSNGEMIAQGGEFEYEETHLFYLPSFLFPSPQPSSSQDPSGSPSQIPSVRPTLTQAPSASPSHSHVPSTSLEPTNNCTLIDVEIFFDSYPEETFWGIILLTDNDGNFEIILWESDYDDSSALTLHAQSTCLEEGQYMFFIGDTFGDGICCFYGAGYYNVSSYGEVIAQGGEFELEDLSFFSIPFYPN